MLTARTASVTSAHIFDVTKTDGPFYCRVCTSEVIAKQGKIRRHHYAHKPDSECHFGSGETDEHLEAKEQLYKCLVDHPKCQNVELEPCFSGGYADIYAEIKGTPVAIEIQRSDMREDDILERTRRFTELGYYTLWLQLAISKSASDDSRYQLSEWRRTLHALYFGKIYILAYPEAGGIIALHMDKDPSCKSMYTSMPAPGPGLLIVDHMQQNSNSWHKPNEDPLLIWTDRMYRWWPKK